MANAFSAANAVEQPTTQAHEHINSIWFKCLTLVIDIWLSLNLTKGLLLCINQ